MVQPQPSAIPPIRWRHGQVCVGWLSVLHNRGTGEGFSYLVATGSRNFFPSQRLEGNEAEVRTSDLGCSDPGPGNGKSSEKMSWTRAPRTSLGWCFQPRFGVHLATFIRVRAGLEEGAAVRGEVAGGQESRVGMDVTREDKGAAGWTGTHVQWGSYEKGLCRAGQRPLPCLHTGMCESPARAHAVCWQVLAKSLSANPHRGIIRSEWKSQFLLKPLFIKALLKQ